MISARFSPAFKRVGYRQAEAVQQLYARMMLDSKANRSDMPPPALLAFEMDPVYTAGRRQAGNFSAAEIAHYKDGGKAEFYETQRGGHVTFHGPGQLVMYPIVDLKQLKLGVRDYVCRLEGGLIDVLKKYGIDGKRTKDNGVWVSDTEKIASVGIHVRRGITSHGISLNVSTNPYWTNRVVNCNLPDATVVSMQNYSRANVASVAQDLAEIYAEKFNLDLAVAGAIDDLPTLFGDKMGSQLQTIYKTPPTAGADASAKLS